MIKIAITGNIATGKSAVEKILRDKGFKVLDTDKVTHELQERADVTEIISKNFNNVLKDGKISRKKLGDIIFNDKKAKKTLENIMHPMIKEEIGRFFQQNGSEKIAFVSIPLLFETGFEKFFDKVLIVVTESKIQLERLMKRNNLTKEDAIKRINSQMPQKEKISHSDYIVRNNGTIDELKSELSKILNI